MLCPPASLEARSSVAAPLPRAVPGEPATFTRVLHGEPHLARRVAILARHPEVRALFGYDRRTALVTFAVAGAQLALAWLFGVLHARGAALGSWWVIALFALVVGAVLTHWLAMSIHECSHHLAAKRPHTNRVISMVANLPMLVPCAMSFHRYHVAHHTYLGVESKDTDLARPFELRLIGTSRIAKLLMLVLFPVLYFVRALLFAKPLNRWEIANAIVQIAVCLAVYQWMGGAALGYLALSFFFGHGIHPVAAHFVHEHYVYAEGQETYSYYGPLNAVTFNVGYHNEHHDFMNVPGWRLPELRARLVPYYRDLESHTSWVAVLVRFVMDPRIGPHTRIVRSPEAFREACKRSRSTRAQEEESDGTR